VTLKTSLGNAVVVNSVQIPYFMLAVEVVETMLDVTTAKARVTYLESMAGIGGVSGFIPGSAYYREMHVPSGYVSANVGAITYPYTPSPTLDTIEVVYRTSDGGADKFIVPPVIGYNDARATKMDIAYNDGSSWKSIASVPLKSNASMNFAYYVVPAFNSKELDNMYNFSDRILDPASLIPAVLHSVKETPFDTNRVQASEIQNPLIYPAKYSYQVGTGEIIALASGTEPLSTGQFGQFPLQVFTSKGIWALQLGSGDILYSNILPVNGEVADNPKNIISIGIGVVYSTVRGLFLLHGMKSEHLSEPAEGFPNHFLTYKAEITKLITDSIFTPHLEHSLSDIDFLNYLLTSRIGYDQIQKELIVINPSKNYCYVLNMEAKIWYTVSEQYISLINSWPNLYALTNSTIGHIVDLSNESDLGSDLTEVLIISNPQHIEGPDIYKKIERGVLRLMASTGSAQYVGIYVLASNDLHTWNIITGKQRTGNLLQDLMFLRSHGSAKYYAFVINGTITTDSEIKGIDIVFDAKLNKKLR